MIQESKSQKKVDYSILSEKRCKVCNIQLKENVIKRNPNACLCYVCFKVSQGKFISNHHKFINGEKILIKTIDFKKLQKQNIVNNKVK